MNTKEYQKALIAEYQRMGMTDVHPFPGEYILLVNPNNCDVRRVYDDGRVWKKKTGYYVEMWKAVTRNLKLFNSWEKMQLKRFTKPGHPTVYVIVQWNQHYGELITEFQIGDIPYRTTVENKFGDWFCGLMEQDTLCGIREFERGSVTYEFLWKPLNLEPPNEKNREGMKAVEFTYFGDFLHAMQGIGYTLHYGKE